MIGFVRGLILVLTSLAVAVGVFLVKRGAGWVLSGWSTSNVVIFDVVIALLALAGIAWTYLLRPVLLKRRLQREQRAEDAGVRQLTVGYRPGDR